MSSPRPKIVGRAAQTNPANRFESVVFEEDFAYFNEAEDSATSKRIATQYLADESCTIISENNSPDLNFRYSLNPYRGCAHGCSYCYARTYHEYLGMSAGLDFETKILYKPKSAQLFRDWLNKQSTADPVNFSGATDCYQPIEKEFELTRQCIQVALECGFPITIVTKNALVLRDLDLLTQLAERNLVQVNLSITSLDQTLTRKMEPRTSSPKARLRAIEILSAHNIPTRALLSPIIPGLNDIEIPQLVEAVTTAGAHAGRSTVVRLPGTVQQVFLEWLQNELPEKAALVESRVRQIRGGELHDARFNVRMAGTGAMADQIRQSFTVFAKKFGLRGDLPQLDKSQFVRPRDLRQRTLF